MMVTLYIQNSVDSELINNSVLRHALLNSVKYTYMYVCMYSNTAPNKNSVSNVTVHLLGSNPC